MNRRLIWLLATASCLWACGPDADQPAERLTIPPGANFTAVTDTLLAHGLVRHRRWFTLVARVRGLDRAVQAGTYDIQPGSSASHILTMLAEGREAMERITIREGLTTLDLAAIMGDRLALSAEEFSDAARDTLLVRRYSPTATSLEGYLFPETYTLPAGVEAARVVTLMAEEFERHWRPEWNSRLDTLGWSRDQVLALASIVEGEAQVGSERATISGVYHNRLRLGMRLQADPTVQYAIQQATGQRKPRLLLRDYEIPSPYNTYLIDGLPPGPVSSPGLPSIEAALYPADVPWLYFVADSTGHHVFTRTYGEHLETIRRLRGQ
ncbi:MAG: endolytic transglycosylase MltG [Gemmatimonadales bacterium]